MTIMEVTQMERLKIDITLPEDEELRQKMFEAYKQCPQVIKYCNELGVPPEVVEENIVKVYDMVSDVNYCNKCPGVKKCAKANPLLCVKLTYSQKKLDRQLVPCKELLRQIMFTNQFTIRDFDEEWLESNLRSIDRTQGRNEALAIYTDFIKNKQNHWIYLTGNKHSGRSYFAASLVVDAAKRERGKICFLNSTLRFRELNDLGYGKKKEEFDRKLELYSNVPILVLDDFGNEYKNDFVRDAILFPILSTRASKRLLTIFTSDFTLEEIEALYSNTKPGAIRARQITRLIRSMCDEEISLGEISVY